MAGEYSEREARQAYVRHRSKTILTFTTCTMTILFIISLMFLFHLGGLGLPHKEKSQINAGKPFPCVPLTDAKDENNQQKPVPYVEYKDVSIRVLNGTNLRGLARAVGDALNNRGFTIKLIGNASTFNSKQTAIVFGKNALQQAYTVASNFTNPVMTMDNREDKLVDIVIGASFSNLRKKIDLPRVGDPITLPKGCQAIEKFTDLPQAPQHEEVK